MEELRDLWQEFLNSDELHDATNGGSITNNGNDQDQQQQQFVFETEEKATKLPQPLPESETAPSAATANRKRSSSREREPIYVFKTRSDKEVMDDGYKWRKYGKKAIKNRPYPRNYYRCLERRCTVKKRIERDPTDESVVITTYEGTHNHECC